MQNIKYCSKNLLHDYINHFIRTSTVHKLKNSNKIEKRLNLKNEFELI